jgi:hypothetical protein
MRRPGCKELDRTPEELPGDDTDKWKEMRNERWCFLMTSIACCFGK